MEIKVVVKTLYGSERIYVVDDGIARALALLTGTKTLTRVHVEALKSLGFTFVVVESISL